MSWNNSDVMAEFQKIAESQDLLGLKKTAAVAPNPHQESAKTIKEKRLKAPEKSIVEVAHPAPVYVAESQGDGALVENQLEQQKKMIEVINKMPTGSLVHRYAEVITELVKVANVCEENGEEEAAALLDTAASILVKELETLPFE